MSMRSDPIINTYLDDMKTHANYSLAIITHRQAAQAIESAMKDQAARESKLKNRFLERASQQTREES